MSDRIDELVAAIDANTLLQWDGKDVALEAAHELATIAREQEAEADRWRRVAKRLALKTSDRDALCATMDGGSFRSPEEWLTLAIEGGT